MCPPPSPIPPPHHADIVRVRPNGDVLLTCGGYYTYTTFLSLNDALQHIGLRVKFQGDVGEGNWIMNDAQGSYPYEDNMVLQARTGSDRSRGQQLWQAMNPDSSSSAPEAAGPSRGSQQAVAGAAPGRQQASVAGPSGSSSGSAQYQSYAQRLHTSNYMDQYAARVGSGSAASGGAGGGAPGPGAPGPGATPRPCGRHSTRLRPPT